MSIFYPAMLRERIQYVTPDDLLSLGVEGILLDVDNTLTKFHSQELSDEVANWLKMMQDEGFKMTVVSNGFAKRVLPFTDKIGLDAVSLSCKPSPIGFWRGAKRLGLPRKKCVAIGDQIFTDVLGSKLAGVKMLLLMPIELEYNRPTILFRRRFEKGIVRRFREKHPERL